MRLKQRLLSGNELGKYWPIFTKACIQFNILLFPRKKLSTFATHIIYLLMTIICKWSSPVRTIMDDSLGSGPKTFFVDYLTITPSSPPSLATTGGGKISIQIIASRTDAENWIAPPMNVP